MNTKSINKQNRPNLKRTVSNDTQTLIFIIATIVITVGLVLYALFSIIKPFENKSFEDIKVVTEEDYLSQEGNKSKEYYVLYIKREITNKKCLIRAWFAMPIMLEKTKKPVRFIVWISAMIFIIN